MVFAIMSLNSLFLRHMREAQSRRLVLGNIHVLYFPGRGDVKLGQVRSGFRELGGSVDLLDHYKLGKHLDFFCKRSLPPSISGTQYLRNVVGDTEIKKGEGMELNQLSKNSSYVRHQRVHLHPFGLDLLTDAFQLREATSADHLLEGIVLPSGAPNLKNEYKEKKQHKKI